MFQFFRKKTDLQKLEELHKNLLAEAFNLSVTNRKKSDAKAAEANEIAIKIDAIKSKV